MNTIDQPKYTLLGYTSEEDIEQDRGCASESGADTLKEARRRAQFWLTEDYMHACEASQLIRVVRILKGREIVDEIRS